MSVTGVLGLAKIGMGLIDKFIPDKDANQKAKMELLEMEANGELQKFMSAAGIVEAEAKSEHWLTANWRPVTMLTFVGLIVLHWLGWTPDNLPKEEVAALLDIVKVGLGGYVVSRGVEKTAGIVYGKRDK